MLEQTYAAQRRVSETNNFTFVGEDQVKANEAGHIANVTNQLRGVLLEVRVLAFGYQCDVATNLRKCPHCNTVWAKEEGCDNGTVCGNMVSKRLDTRFESMANFSFRFDGERLHIMKIATRTLMRNCASSDMQRAGCGQTVAWNNMAPCNAPPEFQPSSKTVTVDDIDLVLPEALPAFRYISDTWVGFVAGTLVSAFSPHDAF